MACYPNSMDAADLHHSSHHKELGEQMDSGLEPLTVTVQVKYIFKDRGVLRKRKFLIPIISFSSSLKDPKPGLTSVSVNFLSSLNVSLRNRNKQLKHWIRLL